MNKQSHHTFGGCGWANQWNIVRERFTPLAPPACSRKGGLVVVGPIGHAARVASSTRQVRSPAVRRRGVKWLMSPRFPLLFLPTVQKEPDADDYYETRLGVFFTVFSRSPIAFVLALPISLPPFISLPWCLCGCLARLFFAFAAGCSSHLPYSPRAPKCASWPHRFRGPDRGWGGENDWVHSAFLTKITHSRASTLPAHAMVLLRSSSLPSAVTFTRRAQTCAGTTFAASPTPNACSRRPWSCPSSTRSS